METPETDATSKLPGSSERRSDVTFDAPHQQPIRLGYFQEISGWVEAIEEDQTEIRLVLSVGTLQYPLLSREAEICRQTLSEQIGNRVAIIRTRSIEEPIRVQVLTQ